MKLSVHDALECIRFKYSTLIPFHPISAPPFRLGRSTSSSNTNSDPCVSKNVIFKISEWPHCLPPQNSLKEQHISWGDSSPLTPHFESGPTVLDYDAEFAITQLGFKKVRLGSDAEGT